MELIGADDTVVLKRGWNPEEIIPTCRKPQTLPIVMSPDEVSAFLGAVDGLNHRVILTVCYAAGLRISEAVHLKATAIDSQRMVIRVEEGKGRKDRYVMLSPKLLGILRDYYSRTRPVEWLFAGDLPGHPTTTSAVELACRKSPRRPEPARCALRWRWRMFSTATDPNTGRPTPTISAAPSGA